MRDSTNYPPHDLIFISAKRLRTPQPQLAITILGLIPFLDRVKIAKDPMELMKLIDFLNVSFAFGTYASIVDVVLHIWKRHDLIGTVKHKREDDPIEMLRMTTYCVSSQTEADDLLKMKLNPVSPLNNKEYTEFDVLNPYIQSELNKLPDVYVPTQPKPVLPTLLPGFCIGPGGLDCIQTPRKLQRNKIIAEIFNRLSANTFSIYERRVSKNITVPSPLFKLQFAGKSILHAHEFVQHIPGVNVFFQSNSSSFGFFMSILQDDESYKSIPWAFRGRTSIRDPETGDQIVGFSSHSALIVEGTKTCPLGEFRIQFFLGPEGWTGWQHCLDYIKSWAPLEADPALELAQAMRALQTSTALACSLNMSARMMDLARGGYAYHGTCVDTTACLKKAVLGVSQEYPCTSFGDGRSCVLAACRLLEETFQGESGEMNWVEHSLKDVARATFTLPDDTSTLPNGVLDSIDRCQASLRGDFVGVINAKRELSEIRKKWEKVFRDKLD